MRTTLTIDDDVLAAAKEMAATERKSLGEVKSALVRQAMLPTPSTRATRNGVPLLPGSSRRNKSNFRTGPPTRRKTSMNCM